MNKRKNWVRVGNKLVNPENTLAVKVIQAGQLTQGVAFSHRPSDEREAVAAAQAKRARKAAKLQRKCYICDRPILLPLVICLECQRNKDLSEGSHGDHYRDPVKLSQ